MYSGRLIGRHSKLRFPNVCAEAAWELQPRTPHCRRMWPDPFPGFLDLAAQVSYKRSLSNGRTSGMSMSSIRVDTGGCDIQ